MKALTGKTVIIARPRSAGRGVARVLSQFGAKVVFVPLIQTIAPRSWRALDMAVSHLEDFDGVVFASANAVDFFFLRAQSILGHKPRAPKLIAAVGPATEKAISAHGWSCSFVAQNNHARGLAQSMPRIEGKRILLPRAERGREELPALLRKAGAKLTTASAYRTVQHIEGRKRFRRLTRRPIAAICFASGSAVASAAAALGRSRFKYFFRTCAAIAIGPTTAAELNGHGVTPAAVSQKPTDLYLAEAVLNALKEQS